MKKRLTKSKDNRMICGVIAGIGEYFNLDENVITLMRIVYALLVLMGFGLVLYIIMAIIMPSEEKHRKTQTSSYSYYQDSNSNYKGRKIKEAEPVVDNDKDDWSDF